jgi:hypothetical protein
MVLISLVVADWKSCLARKNMSFSRPIYSLSSLKADIKSELLYVVFAYHLN